MPLKRLLHLLAALLTLFTLLLVGRLAATEWQSYQRAAAGRAAVDQLHQALTAAERVSRERGPSNGLLADEAQQALPALGSNLLGARLVAELREHAGQLGSHFTAALSH